MPETVFVDLTASKRALGADGVQWIDYSATLSKGSMNAHDLAVIQRDTVTGVSAGSRLYPDTNKSGSTYLSAPTGSIFEAFVVDLIGGGYSGQPPVSNILVIST